MKAILALLLAFILTLGLMTGCSSPNAPDSGADASEADATAATEAAVITDAMRAELKDAFESVCT